MLCPKCNTDSAHRSHRVNLREHLASLKGVYPYRCRKCDHRFPCRRDTLPPPAAGSSHKGVEREISSTRRAMKLKRRRRNLVLYAGALAMFGVVLYFLTRVPSMGG